MAIMIPSVISPEVKSNAERKIFEWFQNSNNCFNDTCRSIEFATLNTFVCRKLLNTILICSAKKVFAFFCISHIHISEKINNLA